MKCTAGTLAIHRIIVRESKKTGRVNRFTTFPRRQVQYFVHSKPAGYARTFRCCARDFDIRRRCWFRPISEIRNKD